MPAVSVIMAAYNASKYISESIDSVISQTYKDWELIVIDDCSKDDTREIIENYCKRDSRIRIIVNQTNLGAANTRNKGFKAANGKWLAIIDSDDIWCPEKLEKQMALIESNPEVEICYTASAYMDESGKRFSYILPAEEKFSYKQLLKKNIMMCSSVIVNKELMLEYPMVEGPFHEDYDSWLTILKDVKYAYGINSPLIIYRMYRGSKSSNRVKSGMMTYRTYRHVGYGSIVSFFYVFRYFFYSVEKRLRIYGVD